MANTYINVLKTMKDKAQWEWARDRENFNGTRLGFKFDEIKSIFFQSINVPLFRYFSTPQHKFENKQPKRQIKS